MEAAHFNKDGVLLWVRAYERRGPTWSDVVLLDREHLIKKLESGKRFFLGKRKAFRASEFQLRDQIHINKIKKTTVITIGKDKKASSDRLLKMPRV